MGPHRISESEPSNDVADHTVQETLPQNADAQELWRCGPHFFDTDVQHPSCGIALQAWKKRRNVGNFSGGESC